MLMATHNKLKLTWRAIACGLLAYLMLTIVIVVSGVASAQYIDKSQARWITVIGVFAACLFSAYVTSRMSKHHPGIDADLAVGGACLLTLCIVLTAAVLSGQSARLESLGIGISLWTGASIFIATITGSVVAFKRGLLTGPKT